jgi:hemolysin activation/secretion protein
VQGAFFADVARAWTPQLSDRGTLGSSGFGLRMPIAEPLVLRLDFGYRFHSGDLLSYGLPPSSRGRKFVDFFFGFNY